MYTIRMGIMGYNSNKTLQYATHAIRAYYRNTVRRLRRLSIAFLALFLASEYNFITKYLHGYIDVEGFDDEEGIAILEDKLKTAWEEKYGSSL